MNDEQDLAEQDEDGGVDRRDDTPSARGRPHRHLVFAVWGYRDSSLITNRAPLGPYSRTMSRALWKSYGWGLFPMSKVPL